MPLKLKGFDAIKYPDGSTSFRPKNRPLKPLKGPKAFLRMWLVLFQVPFSILRKLFG